MLPISVRQTPMHCEQTLKLLNKRQSNREKLYIHSTTPLARTGSLPAAGWLAGKAAPLICTTTHKKDTVNGPPEWRTRRMARTHARTPLRARVASRVKGLCGAHPQDARFAIATLACDCNCDTYIYRRGEKAAPFDVRARARAPKN